MAIDLLALEPTTVTTDLRSKYVLLAAPYKYGKSTFCAHIPNALILAFEPGYNARAGAMVQKINSWSDIKSILPQLRKPEVHEKFQCICWDTIELAALQCQDFVCARAGVQALGEVGYGKLYKEYECEFGRVLRQIAMLGYGMIFTCHTEIKELPTDKENITIERLQPKLDRRAFDIVNSLVDIIGVGVMQFDENGEQVRKLITRETPTVRAGNRFTYFPSVIDFSYQAVCSALTEAIQREAEATDTQLSDKSSFEAEQLNYDALMTEARELWNTAAAREDAEELMVRLSKRIQMIFGTSKKISEITEDQVGLLQLVVQDMRDLLA